MKMLDVWCLNYTFSVASRRGPGRVRTIASGSTSMARRPGGSKATDLNCFVHEVPAALYSLQNVKTTTYSQCTFVVSAENALLTADLKPFPIMAFQLGRNAILHSIQKKHAPGATWHACSAS